MVLQKNYIHVPSMAPSEVLKQCILPSTGHGRFIPNGD